LCAVLTFKKICLSRIQRKSPPGKVGLTQGCQIGFLAPWLFLETLGVKKLFGFFGFFFSIFGFFEAVGTCHETGVLALKCLAECVIRLFRQCLVYFLKSYLEIQDERIKL